MQSAQDRSRCRARARRPPVREGVMEERWILIKKAAGRQRRTAIAELVWREGRREDSEREGRREDSEGRRGGRGFQACPWRFRGMLVCYLS